MVEREKPHLIVPEIEAIATAGARRSSRAEGWTVIPTAQAARLTMDREAIRRVAAEELGLPTAQYQFADTFEELQAAARALGWPVVIKPIMSSSGKGQSVAQDRGGPREELALRADRRPHRRGPRDRRGVHQVRQRDHDAHRARGQRHRVLRSGRPPPGRHPYRFIRKILGGYFWSHVTIALAVVGAVTCSVSTQYGVKYLVDALSDPARHASVWTAFAILITLIAADNMFWRLAAWVGHSTFVNVSGSVRRKLFRHLTGHAPSFFSARSAGALTSRITSTANALYTAENMVTFNVMPPLIATFVAILYLALSASRWR